LCVFIKRTKGKGKKDNLEFSVKQNSSNTV